MKTKSYILLSILFGISCLWCVGLLPVAYQHYFYIYGALWGCIYLLVAVRGDAKLPFSKIVLFSILLLHFSAFLSSPILEDDYFRYSWDGHNLRQGVHPYAQTPFEQVSGRENEEVVDLGFEDLVLEEDMEGHPDYTKKINYPMYRTVYPPLVEVLFVSEALAPNTIYGWPLFIFLIDLLIIYLLVFKSGLSFFTCCLVLTNPLFVKEGLNSWHFDFFLVPLLLLWIVKKQHYDAFIIGLLAGIRPWFLAMSLWRFKDWRLKDYLILLLTLGIPWLTMLLYPGFPNQGFSSWGAFVKGWEFNAVFYELVRQCFSYFTTEDLYFRYVSWISGFALIGVFWYFIRYRVGLELLAIVAWLFFLPTVNPWYIMPIAVILVAVDDIKLKSAGLALCVCMPLAYRHYAHLEEGNYLHWSWALLEVVVGLVAYCTAQKLLKRAEDNNQFSQAKGQDA
jgi:alpha-1,6-mannosyltransferase